MHSRKRGKSDEKSDYWSKKLNRNYWEIIFSKYETHKRGKKIQNQNLKEKIKKKQQKN